MPKLTFYPLYNADTCLIEPAYGRLVLFDYANMQNPDDETDRSADLPKLLWDALRQNRSDTFRVLAITHLDDDHTRGAEDFFYLDHAAKYQDGERAKIETLWVPSGVITETRTGLTESAKALQAEARYRLKKGYGIRVFSRPIALSDWLAANGLTLESRAHFITDAGQLAPEFSIYADGLEFFVHSPFAWRQNETEVVDRNRHSLVMQATFNVSGTLTRAILGSDAAHEALTDMVKTTKRHHREERLIWDLFKLPHHCSYLTIGPDRGDDMTEPVEEVAWLFETQGQRGCYVVSPSCPIPLAGSDAYKSVQPPHRQAANYYKKVVKAKDGEFRVTMEYPRVDTPRPIEIEITYLGARLKKLQPIGAAAITATSAPRAG